MWSKPSFEYTRFAGLSIPVPTTARVAPFAAARTSPSHITVVARFFPRQSGAFHIILALGYLWEYRAHQTIRLMLLAKATAVVFLLIMSPWKEAWSVPFSGIFDGLMLVGMAWLHRMANR